MRIRIRGIFCTLSVMLSVAIFGQSKIVFNTVDYDFGDIKEEDGYAETTFNFINEGDQPIRITNVKASCGCTTPGWTKEEVMPGDSGFVRARYNPRNRPGRFRKSLRISTTDRSSDQTLYIMGFVKPRPKSPEEEYPIQIGSFRAKNRALNIGKITTEKEIKKSFNIYNGSDSALSLDVSALNLPDHIRLALSPSQIGARETGKLIVTYDPIKKKDYGYVSDKIKLDENVEGGLSVIAVIEEFFPEMTAEELDRSPKLEISERVYEFGKVTAGSIVETTFELANSGKEKLEFRAIKSNCGCVTYETKKKGIKKGKSQTLKVMFDTTDLRGNQYKSITIYSNDPVNPTQLITLKGKVEK